MSGRLPRGISGDQAIKALERKGWRVHRRKGSHYALEHPARNQLSDAARIQQASGLGRLP